MQALVDLSEKTISLRRNEFLTRAGDIDTNAYFIEEGSLRVFIIDHDEERIVRFGYRNNLIAILDAYLSGKPTVFYVQALKSTRIRVISKKQIDQFLETPEGKAYWIDIMEHLTLQQVEREIDLLTSSPRERYQKVLQRSPQLFQEIPHRHIANYLRMTPETLSRIKKP